MTVVGHSCFMALGTYLLVLLSTKPMTFLYFSYIMWGYFLCTLFFLQVHFLRSNSKAFRQVQISLTWMTMIRQKKLTDQHQAKQSSISQYTASPLPAPLPNAWGLQRPLSSVTSPQWFSTFLRIRMIWWFLFKVPVPQLQLTQIMSEISLGSHSTWWDLNRY